MTELEQLVWLALEDLKYALPEEHEPDVVELFEANNRPRPRIGDEDYDG